MSQLSSEHDIANPLCTPTHKRHIILVSYPLYHVIYCTYNLVPRPIPIPSSSMLHTENLGMGHLGTDETTVPMDVEHSQ